MHLLLLELAHHSAGAAGGDRAAGPGCPELQVGPGEREAPCDGECFLRRGQQGPRSASSPAGGTGGLPAAAGVRVGHARPRLLSPAGWGWGTHAAVFASVLSPWPARPPFPTIQRCVIVCSVISQFLKLHSVGRGG